jgi:four helix bundle protein
MTTAKRFEELIVWQKAHQLVLAIYRLTKDFPREEIFGLTSQFRRAAVSVPANIAEGFKRATIPDKLRHLNIAQGSLEEVRYYLILSHDLKYGETLDLRDDSGEVGRILEGYMKTLKTKR